MVHGASTLCNRQVRVGVIFLLGPIDLTCIPRKRYGDHVAKYLLMPSSPLPPYSLENKLQKTHDAVHPHDADTLLLAVSHSIICNATDAIVATFEVRRSDEVVIDEESDMPHTIQK